jgi:hypothetical protein
VIRGERQLLVVPLAEAANWASSDAHDGSADGGYASAGRDPVGRLSVKSILFVTL